MTATPLPSATPPLSLPRDGFALRGPSVTLDPRINAVRPDLADVRLAEYVFAPHYAAPLIRRLASPAALRAARDPGSNVLASLATGDAFEVLELAGELAWGIAPGTKLVGYVPIDALAIDT